LTGYNSQIIGDRAFVVVVGALTVGSLSLVLSHHCCCERRHQQDNPQPPRPATGWKETRRVQMRILVASRDEYSKGGCFLLFGDCLVQGDNHLFP